jgi:hypothetical protein
LLEINKNFFEECRKTHLQTGKPFFPIKDWDAKHIKRPDEHDYYIKLSFHIIRPGKEQFLLNRLKKGNEWPDKGVEIPIALSPYVGRCMLEQTGSVAYKKGQCDPRDINSLDGYKFELIRSFPIRGLYSAINFKLMYNSKETKYFLNRQIGIKNKGNQGGVEIPVQFLEQIGRYLIECNEMIRNQTI